MRSVAAWMLVALAWMSSTLFSTPAFAGMVATPRHESSDPAREALAKSVRERAAQLGVSDRVPEKALAVASITQLSVLLDSMGTNTRAGQVEFVIGALLVVLLVVFLILIFTPSGSAEEPQGPPPPPRDPVPPIRNSQIKLFITVNFTYPVKDEGGARTSDTAYILQRFNDDGVGDGNTFRAPNGEPTNFNVVLTINNDGSDHFSGSLSMDGWAWGQICTIGSGQYTYSDIQAMFTKLVDDAYGYIHNGWHENR